MSRFLPFLVAVCFALSTQGAGAHDALPDKWATVSGQVTNSDGAPIARVGVSLQSLRNGKFWEDIQVVSTDPEGRFEFTGIAGGTYRLHAVKADWTESTVDISVPVVPSQEPIHVPIEMRLGLLAQVRLYLQLGSLWYVAIFGILLLALNYFIAPRPSSGVTRSAWGIILFSIVIAWFKMDWPLALPLTLLALTTAYAVQRFGSPVADRRVKEDEKAIKARDEAEERERASLRALIGKKGVATSDLKACGMAQIDGRVLSVRARSGYIALDTRIVVSAVDGKLLVVEPQPTAS